MGVFKNTLAAALTLFSPKVDATPSEFKNNKDAITIVQEENLNSKEKAPKTINFEQIKSEENGSTKEDKNFSDEGSKKFSNSENEFKITSNETVGRTSKDSFSKNASGYIRSAGLGYIGAMAENAPTWLKTGLTGLALFNVMNTTFGSSKTHGSLMNRVQVLGQKFAQGQLASQAIGGNGMEFDMKNFVMAALAFGNGGQMSQLMGQATGMDLGGLPGNSSSVGGR